MEDALLRIRADAAFFLAQEICKAGGNEVFFAAQLDESGKVVDVKTAARGNKSSVPALSPFIEGADAVLHNHPSGNLTPSNADLSIASSLGSQGIGFFIINNDVTEIYVVAEPFEGRKILPIEEGWVEDIFEKKLPETFPGYELRESQLKMTSCVAQAFNGDKIAALEAGTGVGKSLSYLVPALKWVSQNRERVVISTATINLQQQLLEKDIPLVQKILGTQIKTALVKGRGNYLCLRRWEEYLRENALLAQDDKLKAIAEWIDTSADGSRSDLSFVPDFELWGNICAESDSCMGLRCAMREKCFFLKSRREAASSSLLVANHHILFSDLALRKEAGSDQAVVLPPFQRVIIDEAHNIEKNATSFFSDSLYGPNLAKLLVRFLKQKGENTAGPAKYLQKICGNADFIRDVSRHLNSVRAASAALDQAGEVISSGSSTFWIEGSLTQGMQVYLFESLENLRLPITSITAMIKEALDKVPEDQKNDPEAFEAKVVLHRLESTAGFCAVYQHRDEQLGKIFWVERQRYRDQIHYRFVITPLSLSGRLAENLFCAFPTVVCTSATLTIRGLFSYWASRTGVDKEDPDRVISRILKSPFDYQHQVLLAVPNDGPIPDEEGYQDFIHKTCEKALEISEGRALVLFTSYSALEEASRYLAQPLASRGILLLRQGMDDRTRLLATFKTNINSVLLATDSFWEGVDSPGETLSLVIIPRLPFPVPSDPVTAARTRDLENRGINAFVHYSIPEAVIKLKQGFGRLIRKHDDEGVVMILDTRVIKKSYGKQFLDSLPPAFLSVKPVELLLDEIEAHLYRH